MNQSKLIRHAFTEYFNKDEHDYREMIQPKETNFDNMSKYIARINDGRQKILPRLYKEVEFKGKILELGAGSCWFTSCLSRLRLVDQIYCLDFSEFLLENIAPHIMEYLKADINKITRIIGDFNRLYFDDGEFDYIVFDASLHHVPVNDIDRVLIEIYRVLKKNGKIVAIREPFSGIFGIAKKRGRNERKYGVTENIFTKEEWRGMLERNNFICRFIPYCSGNVFFRTPIKFLLHQIFPSCCILCEKNFYD